MKVVINSINLLVFFVLLRQTLGFSNVMLQRRLTKMKLVHTNTMDEIAHELKELTDGVNEKKKRKSSKQHVVHQKPAAHGFNEFHESLVHKLRKTIHEKDHLLHETLNELERREEKRANYDQLYNLLHDIRTHLDESRAYAIAWGTTEIELRNEQERHHKHNNNNGEQQQRNIKLNELVETLQRIEDELITSETIALAWETAEVELVREKHLLQATRDKMNKEHNSIRALLKQVIKLSSKRIKNVFVKIFTFGRK